MSILDCFFTGIDTQEDTDTSECIDVLDNVEEAGDGSALQNRIRRPSQYVLETINLTKKQF